MLIEGIGYDVNWGKFTRGSSFFIPVLDPKPAKRIIREETRRLGYKILMKVTIEEGIRGLRVWRI